MLNLGRFVREHATYTPDKIAVRMGDKTFTYQQVDAMSNQVANYLVSIGIQAGDKVALSCPNLPFFPVVYYGILKAGAVVVPLNVLFKTRELEYHLKDSNAKAYFVFEGTAELPMALAGKAAFDQVAACEHFVVMTADVSQPGPVEGAMTLGKILASQSAEFEIVSTDAGDTAVILYTSGTTGQPKGAELSHLNMVMNAMTSANLFTPPGADNRKQVFMMVLPLFHSFGQTCGMNHMFYVGGEITLVPRFDPEVVLSTFVNHKVTMFAGVPTMYWGLLNAAKNAPAETVEAVKDTLAVCASGGAAMPVELLKKFEAVFNVPIIEGYGLSETSPVASFNHLTRERKPGSVGQAVFGVEIKVVDDNDRVVETGEVGEIVVRGHNIMKGYYERPEATAEALRNGWFHTGDIGRMDEDGYVYVVDRVKDMIIRGGYNVYPREVEETLMEHPDVSLAAVVGVPNEQYGEEIHAYVVLNDDASADVDALLSWSKENMAAYKYPRVIEIRDALPMNATGKILRRTLRDEAKQSLQEATA